MIQNRSSRRLYIRASQKILPPQIPKRFFIIKVAPYMLHRELFGPGQTEFKSPYSNNYNVKWKQFNSLSNMFTNI